MHKALAAAAFLAGLAAPANAQDAEFFVGDNVLAIFYHEMGHALIDVLNLPIYGQEEPAADVASVMLIHTLYEDEVASEMIMSAAESFWADATAEIESEDILFWDTHGASEQRYYNTLCVFYGGSPETREEMITVMGLPEERAETCEEEFWQADHSWGTALESIRSDAGAETFVLDLRSTAAPITELVLTTELAALNAQFALAEPMNVRIEDCGEANAFYDPSTREIIMCTEYEALLHEIYAGLEAE